MKGSQMISGKLFLFLAGGLAISGVSTAAEQFTAPAIGALLDIRCAEDSLNTTQARARLKWAKDNKILPVKTINKWMYTFNEDMHVIEDPLPYYPIFGTWDGNVDNTRIWKPEAHGMPARVPAGNEWIGACRSSCYTPDQELLTGYGYVPIKNAAESFIEDIVTLSPDSLLEDLRYKKSKVGNYTVSLRDTKHDVLTFETLSGGRLQVTLNHPLLDSEGYIREAETFRVGDSLILKNGDPDPILHISEGEKFFGKVYNVRPKDYDLKSNIVVVQGFLNGSSRYQNSYIDKLNRQILHQEFDEALLP